MSEFFFVIKCLVFTALFIVMMQVKIGGASLEYRAQVFLEKSEVALYVQSAAAGGALALKNLFSSVKDGIAGSVDSYKQGAHEQKAGK